MKIHNVAQRSVEWMQLRAGIPTASEFDQLLTPDLKPRTGEMPKSYLNKKLAEAWLGGPLPAFNSFDMEQGNILEEEALPWFELEFGIKVERPGFITTDDGRVGCSPDGLLKDGGLEIKCPLVQTHIGYLLAGVVPPHYRAQLYGSMFVTGLSRWSFISYHRKLPALYLVCLLDKDQRRRIQCALDMFLAAFDNGWERLVELNGGPPVRMRVVTDFSSKWKADENEVPIP